MDISTKSCFTKGVCYEDETPGPRKLSKTEQIIEKHNHDLYNDPERLSGGFIRDLVEKHRMKKLTSPSPEDLKPE
jgi:hypothetical protein